MVQFLISAVEFLATIALRIFGIDYTPEINCEAAFNQQAASEMVTFIGDEADQRESTYDQSVSQAVALQAGCFIGQH